MSDFKSGSVLGITGWYRGSDLTASGFPINGNPTLPNMRQKQRTAFGERLYKARKYAGLTQTELAKKAGLVQGSLGEAEWTGQGSSSTPQIARACGVSAEWLAGSPVPMVDTSAWPFSAALRTAIANLGSIELARLEAVMRAHLGLPRNVASDEPETQTDTRDPSYAPNEHTGVLERLEARTGTVRGKRNKDAPKRAKRNARRR